MKSSSSRVAVIADIYDRMGITPETPIETVIEALTTAKKFTKDGDEMGPDWMVRLKAVEMLMAIQGVSLKDAPSEAPAFGGLEIVIETADGGRTTVKTAVKNEESYEVINVTPDIAGQDQPN
jgi:hypothetical protein